MRTVPIVATAATIVRAAESTATVVHVGKGAHCTDEPKEVHGHGQVKVAGRRRACLLHTSDAADETRGSHQGGERY